MTKQHHWHTKDTLPTIKIPNVLEALYQDLGIDTKHEFLTYSWALPLDWWVILDLCLNPPVLLFSSLSSSLGSLRAG